MFEALRRLFQWLLGTAKPVAFGVVSEALQLDNIPEDAPLRVGIAAVDRVHTDGVLPVTPVVIGRLTKRHGQIVFNQAAGGAVEIAVDERTDRAEWTIIHEIGHLLDWHGIGKPSGFASYHDELLTGWRGAVKRSEAVQRLAQLMVTEATSVVETQVDGTEVKRTVSQRWIRYLLAPEELWARSYAQFVTVRSGDDVLRQRLERLRKRPSQAFYYGAQWEDGDFAAIAAQIEAIFQNLGWIQP